MWSNLHRNIYNSKYHNNCMHLITHRNEYIKQKLIKFIGACMHKLTCRWLPKWGIKIASERKQRQLMQQHTTVLLILVWHTYIGCYNLWLALLIIKFRGEVLNSCEFATHRPFVQMLDKTLKECGVERQAYNGWTFVGNHINKCCKVQNLSEYYL